MSDNENIDEQGEDEEEMDYDDGKDNEKTQQLLRDNLLKRVVQCIMTSCTRRGFCRDGDITDMFTDRKERREREKVLKHVVKEFMKVFGMELKHDDEGKRYYLYNGLKNNLAIKISQWYDKRCGPLSKSLCLESRNNNNLNNSSDEEDEQENIKLVENSDFKRWLLTSTLMFIFMSKRHQSKGNLNEKGIDWLLIKDFLNKLFEKFNTEQLTNKQYMDIFGPSKSSEFISQGWLKCDIHFDQAAGIEDIFYHWGPRAETVINKKEMLQEFINIYGGEINDWPHHAKAAGISKN
ncbi:MAGE domain-containing protein [Meloidogyne graminicola]|uniref:MAGE domain-containing protein n=1 Tax=Meloidogyne graminicola TaxID=189291 RepID=A0A8S9ZMG1_9BILA|nr:MAGE domain-containing protein [Meloidogyne graminicola]